MEGINQFVPILQTFSAMAVSLTAIITLLSLVFKPVRQCVVFVFKRITHNKDRDEKLIKKISEVEETFTVRMDNLESTLSTKIQSVSDRNDENEKDRIRWEILDFANSCRNGRRHSKEEFVHVIELKEKYERLLEKSGDSNGVFEEDFKYIEKLYAERLEKNDFLA